MIERETKNKPSYLLLRNVLNGLFMALTLAFVIVYFCINQPFENVWCVGLGLCAVFVKMVESTIRVVANVKSKQATKISSHDK